MLAGDLPAAADAERPIAAARSDVASVDISRPPKRLPVRSKTIWQTIAPELSEDIILREQEFDRAFSRYGGLGQYAIEADHHQAGAGLLRGIRSALQA
jgi:hypothetical protein